MNLSKLKRLKLIKIHNELLIKFNMSNKIKLTILFFYMQYY